MSFSTDFEVIHNTSPDFYYDNIYPFSAETAETRATADWARINRRLVVPEFSHSTPLDLFDRDGRLVECGPSLSWEMARTTGIPHPGFHGSLGGVRVPSLEDVGGVIYGSV